MSASALRGTVTACSLVTACSVILLCITFLDIGMMFPSHTVKVTLATVVAKGAERGRSSLTKRAKQATYNTHLAPFGRQPEYSIHFRDFLGLHDTEEPDDDPKDLATDAEHREDRTTSTDTITAPELHPSQDIHQGYDNINAEEWEVESDLLPSGAKDVTNEPVRADEIMPLWPETVSSRHTPTHTHPYVSIHESIHIPAQLPVVVVGIITSTATWDRRFTMNSSWIADARAMGIPVHYYTDMNDTRTPWDVVKCECGTTSGGLCCRNHCLITDLATRYPGADWYVRTMDDTMILPGALLRQLAGLQPHVDRMIVGDFFTNNGNFPCMHIPAVDGWEPFGACYAHGGAGIAYSAAAVNAYMQAPQHQFPAVCGNNALDDVMTGIIFVNRLQSKTVSNRGFSQAAVGAYRAEDTAITEVPHCRQSDFRAPESCYYGPTEHGTCLFPIFDPASIHMGNDHTNVGVTAPFYRALRSYPPSQRFALVYPQEIRVFGKYKLCRLQRGLEFSEEQIYAPVDTRLHQRARPYLVNVITDVGGVMTFHAHLESTKRIWDLIIVVSPSDLHINNEQRVNRTATWPMFASLAHKLVYISAASGPEALEAARALALHRAASRNISVEDVIFVQSTSQEILKRQCVALIAQSGVVPTALLLSRRELTIRHEPTCYDSPWLTALITTNGTNQVNEQWHSCGWSCVSCARFPVVSDELLGYLLQERRTAAGCPLKLTEDIPPIIKAFPYRYIYLLEPNAPLYPEPAF